MISRFLALFVLIGMTFAQAMPQSTMVKVGPEWKVSGKNAMEAEAEAPRKDGFYCVSTLLAFLYSL